MTGTYRAELPGCGGSGGFGLSKTIYTFTFSMKPGDLSVTGAYTFDSWYNGGGKSATFKGPVKGEANEDGTVTLVYGPMYTRSSYTFKADGTTVVLTGRAIFECGSREAVFPGTGAGGLVIVPKFSYFYTEKMMRLIDAKNGSLKAGTFRIGEVTELLLEYGYHRDSPVQFAH